MTTDDEETTLWRHAVRDVRPLAKRSQISHRASACKIPLPSQKRDAAPVTPPPRLAPSNGLDRRTAEKLKSGQLPVEARLDLHGLRQDQAREALQAFIIRSSARGLRCILIITGKGTTAPDDSRPWYEEQASGVLRTRVPQWLADASLAPLILRVTPAQARHGGDGALYVLLRRRRE